MRRFCSHITRGCHVSFEQNGNKAEIAFALLTDNGASAIISPSNNDKDVRMENVLVVFFLPGIPGEGHK